MNNSIPNKQIKKNGLISPRQILKKFYLQHGAPYLKNSYKAGLASKLGISMANQNKNRMVDEFYSQGGTSYRTNNRTRERGRTLVLASSAKIFLLYLQGISIKTNK